MTTGHIILGVFNDSDGHGVKGPDDAGSGRREVTVGGRKFLTDPATSLSPAIELPPGVYSPARTSYPTGYRCSTAGQTVTVIAGQTVTHWIGTTNKPAVQMIKGIGDAADADPGLMLPLLRPMRLGAIRVWINTNDFVWSDGKAATKVARAATLAKSLGVVPLFTFAQGGLTPDSVTDAGVRAFVRSAHAYIRRMFDQAGLAAVPVRMQWGNEPNLIGNYWINAKSERDNLATFIDAIGRPFADAGREVGARLIAPGISWNYKLLRELAPDMLKYADAMAYHPYPRSTDTDPANVEGFVRVAHAAETARMHGVGLIMDEAQMHRGPDWAAAKAAGGRTASDALKRITGEITALYRYAEQQGVAEFHVFNAFDVKSVNSPLRAFDSTSTAGVKVKVWGSEFYDLYRSL